MRNVVVLLAVVALAGCSGSNDETVVDSTEVVCDEFAGYVRDGGDRAAVVDSISEVIGNADERVRDGFATVQDTVTGTPGAQQIADDTLAQACFDAGWDG